uniref:SCP domain-containing protein n=1 Tax=Bursaphelenchus xylophilus TaxID=6326 RepID=A0A1I7RQN5_BURXY
MAVLRTFFILSVFISTAASVDVAVLQNIIQRPMNRLEGTESNCLDHWNRQIPGDGFACSSLFAFSSIDKQFLSVLVKSFSVLVKSFSVLVKSFSVWVKSFLIFVDGSCLLLGWSWVSLDGTSLSQPESSLLPERVLMSHFHISDDINGARALGRSADVSLLLDRCNLEVIGMWHSENLRDEGKLDFLSKPATMIVCLCQPSESKPQCDDDFKMKQLDEATMANISRTVCKMGLLNHSTTVSGSFGFCTLSPTNYSAKHSVEEKECMNLNPGARAAYEIREGKCYFCCLADTSKPCNAGFVHDGEFRGIYYECLFTSRFGFGDQKNPNVYHLPEQLPFAEEIQLPRGDMMDSNFRFEKLMAYFQIDLSSMSLKKIATINPVAHAYFHRVGVFPTFYRMSRDSLIFNKKQLAYCDLSLWTAADLAMGCRCYGVGINQLSCCCMNSSMNPALSLITHEFIAHNHRFRLDASPNHWSYREHFIVNRTVIMEE